jgi:biopolymer transport protein ExbB
MVAIPSLIAYRYLRGRVDRIVIEIEKDAISLADALEAADEAADAGEAPEAAA